MPVSKKQTTIPGFGRVSKTAASTPRPKGQSKDAIALAQLVNGESARASTKRKREQHEEAIQLCLADTSDIDCLPVKKPKFDPPSPPSTQHAPNDGSPISRQFSRSLHVASPKPDGPPELSQDLQCIISLHECFIKALFIHYSHNGPSAPAELSSLMTTITCMYKKSRVVKEDIQRMLALYEVAADIDVARFKTVHHHKGPFRLTSTNTWTSVEYVGQRSKSTGLLRSPFNEKLLQSLYKRDVETVTRAAQDPDKTHLSFLHGPLVDFPLLACAMGSQTVARQAVALARRTEILNLSHRAQARQQTKSFTSTVAVAEDDTQSQVQEKVKSRSLALFDRVRTKQLLNASSTAPTPQSMLRSHAIGRVAEVVEIVRMKQQQKLSSTFVSSVHISPSKVRGKVSFSLGQLVQEIKNSVNIPIADDEARMCLELIEKEVPGLWLTSFEMGTGEHRMKSVVLVGSGKSGKEVQQILQDQEKKKA